MRKYFVLFSCLIIIQCQFSYSQTKSKLVNKIKESVVWIHAFGMPSIGSEASYGTGTGYVVSNDGLIITNHHVIKGANGIIIFAQNSINQSKYYGTVIISDSVLDLAVIKAVDCNLKPLEIENSYNIQQGDEILVLGYPGSGYKTGNMKVSWGILSSQTSDSTIQTTAAINSGNSGGPAINLDGKCIGTVFAKMVGISIEGTGFIRNISYTIEMINKAKNYIANFEYFGTKDINAYKKICEAETIGWEAEMEENNLKKIECFEKSKKLILDAIDIDPKFAEAHYFLGGYFLKEALVYCLANDDAQSKLKVKDFLFEMKKAEEIKPSLRYKNDFNSTMQKIIEDGSLNCSTMRQYVKDYAQAELDKEDRLNEFYQYIYTGKTPEKLKKSIMGYTPYSYNSYSSSGSNTNKTYSSNYDKYDPIIPGLPVTIYFRLPILCQILFDKGDFNTDIKNFEIQCEVFDNVRPIFSVIFDNINEKTIFNLGLNVSNFTGKFTLSSETNPFLHNWSLDYTTKLPGKDNGNDISVIWTFGLGQISYPKYSYSFPDFKEEKGNTITIRTSFEFKLVKYFWIDFELISPINKPDENNLFDNYYQLIFGFAFRI